MQVDTYNVYRQIQKSYSDSLTTDTYKYIYIYTV